MAVVGAKPAPAKQRRPPLVEPGIRVEHYEIIRELGRGGMGEVHLARDVRLGRLVALKFIIPSSPEVAKSLLIEARATAKCKHENIVVIHDMNEFRGMPYLVLEYLEGKPLSRLHSESRLPLIRIIEVMIEVARALDHAHRAGIVHRDLKPDNIFVTAAGEVKVLDFGIAKLQGAASGGLPPTPDSATGEDDETYITMSSNGPIGTRPYMAPEQWAGVDIDHRTDIWAVGVIMFRLVTGQHPFEHLDGQAMMYAVMSPLLPVRSVAAVIPDFHPELGAIIDRCLRKAKAERFGNARDLLDALEPLLPRSGPPAVGDRCPYPGLAAFQESDAERFFGRTEQVARVVGRLAAQPLVSIVGPSGVGKSSFVRAGLVPALKREGPWATIAMRPGRAPLAALAALADPGNAHNPEHVRAIAMQLFTEPGYLGALLRWRAANHGCRVLLYVDQFEELYTLVHDPRERVAFVTALRAAADDPSSPVRVVLSLRSDFLDRAAEDRAFMAALTEGMHYLMPLGHDGLTQALVRPAEQAGHAFESGELIGRMVGDVAMASGALPLLQFAAARMWDARDRQRRTLTFASYAAMGGIAGALAVHADAVLAELSPARRPLVQAVFQRLVTADGTRAIVDLDELYQLSPAPGEVRAVIDQLVSARLLVSKSDEHGTGASVELIHESLITAWPQLQQWAEAGREEAAFLVQLRQAAAQWESRGRPAGLLWRGDAADEARRFGARLGDTLGPRERRFVDEVIAHASRSSRIKRLAVVATIVILAGLVLAGGVAVIWVRGAEQEAVHQAEAARKAQKQVADQLQEVQDKEAQRARAEAERVQAEAEAQAAAQRAQKASKEAEAATGDAKLSRTQLERANQDLTKALDDARKATEQEKALRERVEKLLVQERQRNDAAAHQRSKITTDLR